MSQFIPAAFAKLSGSKALAGLAQTVNHFRPAGQAVRDLRIDNLEDLFCLASLPGSEEYQRKLTGVIVQMSELGCSRWHDGGKGDPARGRCPDRCTTVSARYCTMSAPAVCDMACNTYGVCVYHAFLSQLVAQPRTRRAGSKPTSVIITTNYDLVIERALSRLDEKRSYVSYGRGVKDHRATRGKRPLRVLKLHGSINWTWREGTPCVAGPVTEAASNRGAIRLIPPTWNRGVSDEGGEFFVSIIMDAISELRKAGRIVVIGYSMPLTDRYFRDLLCSGLNTPDFPDIEFWNLAEDEERLSARLRDMFGERFGKRVRFCPGGLTGFVEYNAKREG